MPEKLKCEKLIERFESRISSHPFKEMRGERGEKYDVNMLIDEIELQKSKNSDLIENINCFKIVLGKRRRIEGVIFENVNFSRGKFEEVTFVNCHFVNCQFVSVEFKEVKFNNSSFINCYFLNPNFKGVYVHLDAFDRCLSPDKHANLGVTLFQHLKNNFNDMDQPFLKKEADFLFMKWKRYQLKYESKNAAGKMQWVKYKNKILSDLFYQYALGYGIKLRYFIGFSLIIYVFWLVFNLTTWDCFDLNIPKEDDCSVFQRLTNVFYFTTISLSNLGYGDVVPGSIFGKIFSSIQAVIGAILFAVLASMLFKKFSR